MTLSTVATGLVIIAVSALLEINNKQMEKETKKVFEI